MDENLNNTNKHSKAKLFIKSAALVFAVLIVGLAIASYFKFKNQPLLSKDVIESAGFSLYVPSKYSPAVLDKNSVKYLEQDRVVTYNLIEPGGKIIAVSQIRKPADLEVNKKINTPINLPTYKKEFTTGYGSAVFDIWDNKKVISMLTIDNTWIIFNYTGVEDSAAQNVASSLERIK